MIIIRTFHTDEISVVFPIPFQKKWITRIKSITGKKWHPDQKMWTIPRTEQAVLQFVQLFANEPMRIEEVLRRQFIDLRSLSSNQQKRDISISDALRMLSNQLKLKGYSIRTQKAYMGHINRFHRHISGPPTMITIENIQSFLLDLLDQEHSHSYVNQALSALKFYLMEICDRTDLPVQLTHPKKEKKLPNVLSPRRSYADFKRFDKSQA